MLLASVLGYILTGFAMTKGLLGTQYVHQITELHTKHLPLLMIFSFSIHTPYAIHLAFKRWRIWNGFTKIALIAAYVLFFLSFLFIDLVYKKPITTTTNAIPSTVQPRGEDDDATVTTPQTTQPATPGNKTFTLSELAQYNGQNGQPAYVAVNGVVYNLSTIFAGGQHKYHFAGRDLTNEFNSRHTPAQIQKYPSVGTMR